MKSLSTQDFTLLQSNCDDNGYIVIGEGGIEKGSQYIVIEYDNQLYAIVAVLYPFYFWASAELITGDQIDHYVSRYDSPRVVNGFPNQSTG